MQVFFHFYSFKSLKLDTPPYISGGVSSWLFHIILIQEDGFIADAEDGVIADFVERIIHHIRDVLESSIKVIYFNIIVIIESTKPVIAN